MMEAGTMNALYLESRSAAVENSDVITSARPQNFSA